VSQPWLPRLVGERCTLRALTPDDATAIACHADDAAVARNLHDGFPNPYTLADAQAWCGAQHREPVFGRVWAVTVADEAIGCIGVVPQSGVPACNAEVGYWIGRAHWGRGIAVDALRSVTAWAWQSLPEVQRLVAPIFARNLASQRVATKAGYVLEAHLPRSLMRAGEVIDVVQYAVHRA
jgi:ribosomal-protein-alanine N-acetyltransferase